MKDPLVRFGVAIEGSLLRDLDALAGKRNCTRSELLRDLARAEVARARVPSGIEGVGALTLVYDHHVRDLSEKLTELQHQMGDDVRAALHIHLNHDLCLEVVVMQGRSDRLKLTADRILALRGVKHGGIEIIPGVGAPERAHHHHDQAHDHDHDQDHDRDHPPPAEHPPGEPEQVPENVRSPRSTRSSGSSRSSRRSGKPLGK